MHPGWNQEKSLPNVYDELKSSFPGPIPIPNSFDATRQLKRGGVVHIYAILKSIENRYGLGRCEAYRQINPSSQWGVSQSSLNCHMLLTANCLISVLVDIAIWTCSSQSTMFDNMYIVHAAQLDSGYSSQTVECPLPFPRTWYSIYALIHTLSSSNQYHKLH